MTSRVLGVAAAVITLLVAVVYALVMRDQGDSPATWFLAVLVVAALLAAAGSLRPTSRSLLVVATVLLAAATLVSLASVGLFLLPALAMCSVALAVRRRDRVARP